MKKTLIWILGLIGGFTLCAIGIVPMMLINWLLFEYLPNWGASILGLILSLLILNKTFEIAFFDFPYTILRIKSLSLMYVFMFFILSSAIFNLYNHEYFDQFSGVPKWIYLTIQVLSIFILWGLFRKVQQIHMAYKKDIQDLEDRLRGKLKN